MSHVSQKLRTPIQGALAGGGDPATSPLYVFGPFLRLIVVAGVAEVTFGASIWLVIFTIAMVSAMYRLVMGWITDGSGGSGLSEEEFGGWAVKTNGGHHMYRVHTHVSRQHGCARHLRRRSIPAAQRHGRPHREPSVARDSGEPADWLACQSRTKDHGSDFRPGNRRGADSALGNDGRHGHRNWLPPPKSRFSSLHPYLLGGHFRRVRPHSRSDDGHRDLRQYGRRLRRAPGTAEPQGLPGSPDHHGHHWPHHAHRRPGNLHLRRSIRRRGLGVHPDNGRAAPGHLVRGRHGRGCGCSPLCICGQRPRSAESLRWAQAAALRSAAPGAHQPLRCS